MNPFSRLCSTVRQPLPAPRAAPAAIKASAIGLIAAGLLCAAPAFAGLSGHTVQADYLWPSLNQMYISSGPAVVGAGVEFSNPAGWSLVDIDFSDTSILLTYNGGWILSGAGTFDGWVFSDLSAAGITGVSLQGSNMPGLSSANLSFSGNQVFLNTLGLGGWGPGTFVSIDLQFADAAAVPEPMALSLAGVALLLLGSSRRRPSASRRPVAAAR